MEKVYQPLLKVYCNHENKSTTTKQVNENLIKYSSYYTAQQYFLFSFPSGGLHFLDPLNLGKAIGLALAIKCDQSTMNHFLVEVLKI